MGYSNYLFTSERLGFRNWKDDDVRDFSVINQDDKVMEYFPSKLSVEETKDFIKRLQDHFTKFGHNFYAVELLENKELIGFIGLADTKLNLEFTPCKEIGWRLKQSVWNKGYATEGAKRVLEYGFNDLDFNEIVSFTAKVNIKSKYIMKKIGMTKVGEFIHPKIEGNHLLNPHVLYKIERNLK